MPINYFDFPLQDAVLAGDLKLIEELILRSPESLNIYDLGGYSALDNAVRSGNLDALRLLVKYEVNINAQDHNGITALHLAAKEGSLEMVMELLRLGVNVHPQDRAGRDAMVFAISGEPQTDIIDALIKGGMNIDRQFPNQHGYLAHSIRMIGTSDASVRCLLQYPIGDENMKEALDIARKMQKHDIVKMIEGAQLAKLEKKILSEAVGPLKEQDSPTRSSAVIRI